MLLTRKIYKNIISNFNITRILDISDNITDYIIYYIL